MTTTKRKMTKKMKDNLLIGFVFAMVFCVAICNILFSGGKPHVRETSPQSKVEKSVNKEIIPEFPPVETDKVLPDEMGIFVQSINYMTGCSESYYPYDDIDEVQSLMAEVVWDRIQSPDFPNTFQEVLDQNGQFPDVPTDYTIPSDWGSRAKQNIVNVLENTEDDGFKPLYAISCTEVPEISGDNVVIQKKNGTYIVFCEDFPD